MLNYLMEERQEKEEVASPKTEPFKISDSILLFISPVYLYLLINAYEIGYADYFAIPTNLVSIKLSSYSSSFIIITFALVLIGIFVLIPNSLIKKIYSNEKHSSKKKLAFGVVTRSFIFTYLLIIQWSEFSILSVFIYFVIFSTFILFFLYLDIFFLLEKNNSGSNTPLNTIFILLANIKVYYYFCNAVLYLWIFSCKK